KLPPATASPAERWSRDGQAPAPTDGGTPPVRHSRPDALPHPRGRHVPHPRNPVAALVSAALARSPHRGRPDPQRRPAAPGLRVDVLALARHWPQLASTFSATPTVALSSEATCSVR